MSDLSKHYIQLVGIAKSWALKNMPGWSEDSHRDLLERHGAVAVEVKTHPWRGLLAPVSAKSLNVPQLGAVLDDYERRGWPRVKQYAAKGSVKPKPVPPRIAQMVKLWGKLGLAGKVTKATRPALLAWCARQTAHEVADLDSLSVEECQKLIEAMKSWLGRA